MPAFIHVDAVHSSKGGFDAKVVRFDVKVEHKYVATQTNQFGDRSKDAIRATNEHENKHITIAKQFHDQNQNKVFGHFPTEQAAKAAAAQAQRQLQNNFTQKATEHQPKSAWREIMRRENEGRLPSDSSKISGTSSNSQQTNASHVEPPGSPAGASGFALPFFGSGTEKQGAAP